MINSFKDEHRFLSNFYKAGVSVPAGDGHDSTEMMPTVEHAYVVMKVGSWLAFQDAVTQHNQKIPGPPIHLGEFTRMTPGQAKRLGRAVPLREDWDDVKLSVMLDLLFQKFAHPELAAKLLATGDQKLIEGNYWHDQYWGECTCPKHIFVPGKNALGKLLMQVRMEVR